MKDIKIKLYAYFLVARSNILKLFYKVPQIMSPEETIDFIIQSKCSIGRFGDGEMNILLGIWWQDSFQSFNPELRKKLAKLQSTTNFLVCLPDTILPHRLSKELLTKQEYDYWLANIHQFDGFWRRLGGKNAINGNSFISRFYIRYNDRSDVKQYVDHLKQLWQDRDIIFIEGEKTRCGVGNDLFDNAKSIKRILCPETQAFDKYDRIVQEAKTVGTDATLFLLALGQTATPLAKDLSDLGFQALDIGHMDIEYEWYIAKATKKEKVIDKYVREACGGKTESNLNEPQYLKSIICTIK